MKILEATDACDLDAVQARRLIGAKRLSVMELLESCIGRIEAIDHAVNAVVARDYERARAAAKRADEFVARRDKLGVLHGLPIGIKDSEATEGLLTTRGSPMFRHNVPTSDHELVARHRQVGAIVLGKTNVPEFMLGGNTRNTVYGATGNPFDPRLSAGGSAGGSAAALACGMVPISTGYDHAGSMRVPASFCGVVGFRPSAGIVSRELREHGASGLPVPCPMARTVSDICLLLHGMVATVPGSPPHQFGMFAHPAECDLHQVRVAITSDLGFALTDSHIRRVFFNKVSGFQRLFARVQEASPDCSGSDRVFEVLRAVGVLGYHTDRVREHPAECGPNVHANVQEGLRYTALDVAQALAMETAIYKRWQEFFVEHDIILTPAVTISPPPWSELYPKEIEGNSTRTYFHWLALTYAITVVGHPAICLPVGRDEAGMPFGIQIVGRRGADDQVIAFAAALEATLAEDTSTGRPLPDVAKLASSLPLSTFPGFLGSG